MRQRKYFFIILVVIAAVVAGLAFITVRKVPKEGEVADQLPEAGIYPAGTVLEADLNGDGEEETLRISPEESQTLRENYYVVDIQSDIWGNARMKLGSEEYLYLARLDRENAWMAIGIADIYEDTSSGTEFYRYTEGKLESVGTVFGTPEGGGLEGELYVDEEGTVHSYKLLSLPSGWLASSEKRLDETGLLQETGAEYYEPIQGEQEVYLLQELPIYEEPLRTSIEEGDADREPAFMKPQRVWFTATDDQNWCKLQGEDGSEGWFYVEDWTWVADLGVEMEQVFWNLSKSSEDCRQLIRLLGQPVMSVEGLPERAGNSDLYVWEQNLALTAFTAYAELDETGEYIQDIWLNTDFLSRDDAHWTLGRVYQSLTGHLDGEEQAGEQMSIPEAIEQLMRGTQDSSEMLSAETSWLLTAADGQRDGGIVTLSVRTEQEHLGTGLQNGAVIRVSFRKEEPSMPGYTDVSREPDHYATMHHYMEMIYSEIEYLPGSGSLDMMQYNYEEMMSVAAIVAVVTPLDALSAENSIGTSGSGASATGSYSRRKVEVVECFKGDLDAGTSFTMAEKCVLREDGTLLICEDCYPMQMGDYYLVFLQQSGSAGGNFLPLSFENGKCDLTNLYLNSRGKTVADACLVLWPEVQEQAVVEKLAGLAEAKLLYDYTPPAEWDSVERIPVMTPYTDEGYGIEVTVCRSGEEVVYRIGELYYK